MKMDDIDEIIREIQTHPDTELSAEARNTLHGCTSSHPWCRGKSRADRIVEARMAIAGRSVHARLAFRLERAPA